jgi:hypothetical protein
MISTGRTAIVIGVSIENAADLSWGDYTKVTYLHVTGEQRCPKRHYIRTMSENSLKLADFGRFEGRPSDAHLPDRGGKQPIFA